MALDVAPVINFPSLVYPLAESNLVDPWFREVFFDESKCCKVCVTVRVRFRFAADSAFVEVSTFAVDASPLMFLIFTLGCAGGGA